MSIVSGYKKFKKYILTSSGFQLVSHWTKANTLEFDDGKTAQAKLGAIDGISSSRESNSDKIAASTALVSELNSDLVNRGLDYAARERITSFTTEFTAITAGVVYACDVVSSSSETYATVYVNGVNLWSYNGYMAHKRIPIPPIPLTTGDKIKIIATGNAEQNSGFFVPYK